MKTIFTLLLLSICSLLYAQNKETDKPSIAKATAGKLKGFDEYVSRVMKDWKVQGLAIAIVHKDKVVLAKGYGFRNVDQKLPVTPETLFAIGSCSKAFTAAGVCLLQDEGKVDLDKPVRDYLPDFKLYDAYVSDNITPRDLLSHRSGLPRHDLVWYGSPFTRKELYSRLRYLEPSKPFRAAYQYQNLMFMTAGYLVEEVSGMPWEVFTRDKVLTPLGMTSTNFSITDLQKSPEFATGYVETKDNVEVMPYMNIDALGPAGSMNSSVTDMSHWLIALINGGKFNGKALLSANAVRQMQTPTMVLPAEVPPAYEESFYNMYGLGWIITSYRGHLRVEHGGNIDGFSASTCFLPKDSIGVVVLTNMNGTPLPSVIRNNVLDRMLGISQVDWNKRLMEERSKARAAQEKAKKADDANRVKDTKPSHALEAYAGTYEHPGYGTVSILLENNQLQIQMRVLRSPVDHYHYDIFYPADERFRDKKINFITSASGNIDQLSMKLEPGVKDIVFDRTLAISSLEPSSLARYTGEYDFGGQIARVYVKNEKSIYLLVPGQPEYELVPTREHEFRIKILEGFNVKFEVDANGKTTDLVSVQPNGTFRAKKKQG